MASTKSAAQRVPTTLEARALSVKASVDPRSILKEAAQPGSVKGISGERCRSALADWRADLARAEREAS